MAINPNTTRDDLLSMLAQPGGSIVYVTPTQQQWVDSLSPEEKEQFNNDATTLIKKKLFEFDSLILNCALTNMNHANKGMCNVNFGLVTLARQILREQNSNLETLIAQEKGMKSPFDLSFLLEAPSKKTESQKKKKTRQPKQRSGSTTKPKN